jgi:peptidoglycan/LPS O-acetylase OafA/YrhL
MTVVQAAGPEPQSAPSPAVAPPPGNPRFALIDSLRAIAVLAVLTFHVTSLTGALGDRLIGDVFGILGTEGLTLFFVISGFLLYRPYVASRARGRELPSTRRYARRRVLRIVPAYWAALTLLAIYPGIHGVFSGDWWRYYFFLQLYSARTVNSGLPIAWTLCVEVSFYLLLPLWALATRRVVIARGSGRGGRAGSWIRSEYSGLALLMAIGAVTQVLAARRLVSATLTNSLLGECTWFALGMALAVASVQAAGRERPSPAASIRFVTERSGICWFAALLCLLGVAAVLHPGSLLAIVRSLNTPQPVSRTIGAIVLSAALMTLLVGPAVFGEDAGGVPRAILRAAPLAWIGLVSYGIYLWHLPIAELLALKSDPQHFSASGLNLLGRVHGGTTVVLLLATLLASCAVAALSYYGLELPFLRRKER